jgi:hypothetical protein
MRHNSGAAHNTSRCTVERHRRIFGFKEHPLFNAPPEAERVPKVNFGNKPS